LKENVSVRECGRLLVRTRTRFEQQTSVGGRPHHPEYEDFLKVLDAPELAQRNVLIGNAREYARPSVVAEAAE
jgi:hypothetical protein